MFVTHSRKDYILLDGAWHRWPPAWGVVATTHPGILVLDRRPEPVLVAALIGILTTEAPAFHDGLYWWRAGRGWQSWLLGEKAWTTVSGG